MHALHAPVPVDPGGKDRPEPVPPEAYCLMRDVDSSLVPEVLDVPQRVVIRDIHHHRQTDDFRRGLEVSKPEHCDRYARASTLPCQAIDFNLTMPTQLLGATGRSGDACWRS